VRYYHNFGEDRAKRKDQVLRAVEENPGIELKTLSSVLSLQMKVSPKKVLEYVKELDNAGLLTVEFTKAFPRKRGLEPYVPKDTRPETFDQ